VSFHFTRFDAFDGLIKVYPPVYKERLLLGVDISLLSMVLIFVEYLWETSLIFDIALSETVGALKAQIQAITRKPIGMNDKSGMNSISYPFDI